MSTYDAATINYYLQAFNEWLNAPTGMLQGIAETESSYDVDTGAFRNVRNSLGATGLMQLKPIAIVDIKRAYKIKIDPYDPLWSIYGAALLFLLNLRYIRHYTGEIPTWNALIVAYNGGWSA